MDIGSICVCMAIGALIVFASIGIGVCIGDRNGKGRDNGQSIPDSDVRIYVYNRDRNRRRDKRVYKYSDEEMIFVLHNLKRLTHGWERDIIDAMIEEKEGSEK